MPENKSVMKCLILLMIVLVSGCSAPEPKYKIGQCVKIEGLGIKTIVGGNLCVIGDDHCDAWLLFESGETRYFQDDFKMLKACDD